MHKELTLFLCITIILFYSEDFLMYPLSQFLHNSIIKLRVVVTSYYVNYSATYIARATKTKVTGI